MKNQTIIMSTIFLMIVVIIADPGCKIPENPSSGMIEVLMMSKDAKGVRCHTLPPVEAVWISIVRVEIHKEDSGWITVVDNGNEGVLYNLMDIAEDATIVGINELETGHYTQIRLIVGNNNSIITNDGSGPVEHELTIPGGEKTGIKLVSEFDITEAGRVRIVLDFSVEESIVATGCGTYKLKPTIRIAKVEKVLSLVFKDDFEVYSPGEYPASNGWYMLWSGAGNSYVVNGISNSFEQSFRLNGVGSWVRSDGIKLDLTPVKKLVYQVAVMVPSNNPTTGKFGFFQRTSSNTSRDYNSVLLDSGRMVFTVKGGAGVVTDCPWEYDRWYVVKVSIDYENLLMDLWVDGNRAATGIQAEPKETSNIFFISTVNFYSGSGTPLVYYDDIEIYTE